MTWWIVRCLDGYIVVDLNHLVGDIGRYGTHSDTVMNDYSASQLQQSLVNSPKTCMEVTTHTI